MFEFLVQNGHLIDTKYDIKQYLMLGIKFEVTLDSLYKSLKTEEKALLFTNNNNLLENLSTFVTNLM